jgi:hypothetical protein
MRCDAALTLEIRSYFSLITHFGLSHSVSFTIVIVDLSKIAISHQHQREKRHSLSRRSRCGRRLLTVQSMESSLKVVSKYIRVRTAMRTRILTLVSQEAFHRRVQIAKIRTNTGMQMLVHPKTS